MLLKLFVASILVTSAFLAHAGPKEDFIAAVTSNCKLSPEEAEKLATPGRSGNVIKLSTCPQNPVEITPTCKVKCSTTSGTVIGE